MADQPRPPDQEQDPAETSAGAADGRRQSPQELSSWHRLAGVGIEFIAAFGVCGWAGWWLDRKFETAPWLLIAGCGLGFAVGLWGLVKAARQMM